MKPLPKNKPKTDSMEESKNMTKQGWKNFVENCSLGGGTDAIGDWYMFYKEDVLSFISQELSTFAKEVDGIIDKEEDVIRIAAPNRMLTMLIILKQVRQALTNLKKEKGI